MHVVPVYLALGDSMSIDTYTNVVGGGAVNQFFRSLGDGWTLIDRSFDGCLIRQVPTDECGELITLTIAGNDLMQRLGWLIQLGSAPIPESQRDYVPRQIMEIATEHRQLLQSLRSANPDSQILVGNVYAPAPSLQVPPHLLDALDELNGRLAENTLAIDATVIDLRTAFRGRESELLVMYIEPNHAGASEIARRFREARRS